MWSIRLEISRRTYGLLAMAGLLVPLLAWGLLSAFGGVNPVFLPGPDKVVLRLISWATEDDLLGDAAISTLRVVAGWALSALIAVPLGLFIGSWRAVQALLEPLTDFIRYMPAVAFIPLVMLWVGIEEGAKVAIIFIGTFFQMVLMVAEDVRRVPMAQRSRPRRPWAPPASEMLEKVILPSAKPALWTPCASPWAGPGPTWWWPSWWRPTRAGLCHTEGQRFLQTDKIFAGILLIGFIGLAIDQLFRLLHRKAFPGCTCRDEHHVQDRDPNVFKRFDGPRPSRCRT
jgi:NitT/TauT family transport system permease protein